MADLRKEMIFGTQKKKDNEQNTNKELNNIKNIEQLEVSRMVDFREGQPFSLYSVEKMEQMKESILRNGILVPIIVRKIENDKYEIIAGHNRVRCARELGMVTVPATIVDVDDNVAKLIMLETNLCQRDNIPPTEKGLAYKIQLEILKKMREEGAVPVGQGYSIEELSEKVEESMTNIKRLIRLTELIKPLQDKVNANLDQVSIRAGVELSYINPEEQEIINKVLDENNLKLKISQAETLRSMSGEITEKNILELFITKNKEKTKKFTGKLNKETLKKYKEKFSSDDDFNQLVDKLLEEHFKNIA